MQQQKDLAIGKSDLATIIRDNCIYVDKTKQVYESIVLSNNNVYIFEFKINKDAKEAMKQIHEKQYYNRFVGQNKKIYLIGMNYDTKAKIIDDYLLEELES